MCIPKYMRVCVCNLFQYLLKCLRQNKTKSNVKKKKLMTNCVMKNHLKHSEKQKICKSLFNCK